MYDYSHDTTVVTCVKNHYAQSPVVAKKSCFRSKHRRSPAVSYSKRLDLNKLYSFFDDDSMQKISYHSSLWTFCLYRAAIVRNNAKLCAVCQVFEHD